MSQLDDQMAGSVLMSDEKVRNPVQLHQIRGEQDVIEASELCIDVFFGNEGNFFKGMMLKKLRRQQVFDLLQRLWHRVDDFMIKAVGINGNMLGFAETFVYSLDAEVYGSYLGFPAMKPLNISDGRIYLPKIANLAVIPEARNLGIGRQLVDACVTQSREWGYDQVLLQVESDNKVARVFYKKLGFEELLTDNYEKRYDLTGFFLVMKPAPKVLLRKVITDYKSYEIEEL
mmetsp:Transcript_2614/g.2729  ORF Transcript_2614/g.2729 Transcript_2614/m.2729 type:complete len:230 (+) Transcript_2614:314-1003(+)|eukprot:CAMPEP_0119047228 /NCGR_PEP_ID=MMETSP1177-20130426/51811_1 /TAXON_ID=2985 /ORGANISM="Ochromonas sp, Strain CCMP1899" /LENGTH=229 /DNA_ID=CAMNT_0007021539 /DNA_START=269 /DNA_END=958 /DNA_ORIENTATION=-